MTEEVIEFQVSYDAGAVRKAYRELFLWTQFGWITGLGLIFIFGLGATISSNRDYRWIGGFFLGVSVVYFYSIYSSWRGVSRASAEKAGEQLLVRLSKESISFKGKDFQSEVYWNTISNAGVLNGNWFLDLSGNYTLLPKSTLPGEADSFIRARFRERKTSLARWSDHPGDKRAAHQSSGGHS